jgi:hypothetical protein
MKHYPKYYFPVPFIAGDSWYIQILCRFWLLTAIINKFQTLLSVVDDYLNLFWISLFAAVARGEIDTKWSHRIPKWSHRWGFLFTIFTTNNLPRTKSFITQAIDAHVRNCLLGDQKVVFSINSSSIKRVQHRCAEPSLKLQLLRLEMQLLYQVVKICDLAN